MKKMGLFVFLMMTVSTWAAELSVQGRNYTLSCGYFTSVQADLEVSFRDTTLPWGSSVTLISGWAGREGFPEKRYEWREKQETAAQATAPYLWTIKLHKVLHERTEANFRDTLNFVFKVSIPGRTPYFVNGGSSWGFYSTKINSKGLGPCVNGSEELPALSELEVETLQRF
ncbi:MAG: hypothetical protein ACKOA8_08700 [Deltaproteobacteria bacterium]